MKSNRNDSVEFGILLVGIGIIWLLFRMDILDFSFMRGLRVLWPGVFIVAGLSIIFSNVRGASTVLWIIFIIMILGYGNFYTFNGIEENSGWINFDINVSDWKYSGHESGVIDMEDYDAGNLIIEYPAGDIEIDNTKVGLVEYEHPKNLVDIDVSGSSIATVNFKIDEWPVSFGNNSNKFDMVYYLNSRIPWDIEINTGAMDSDLDLSGLLVERLDINTAAGDVNIKMSDEASRSEINLQTAAADISLELPEEVGVKLDMDGLVKDININDSGWTKDDGDYYSDNYHEADKIIIVNVTLVAGELTVDRY